MSGWDSKNKKNTEARNKSFRRSLSQFTLFASNWDIRGISLDALEDLRYFFADEYFKMILFEAWKENNFTSGQ